MLAISSLRRTFAALLVAVGVLAGLAVTAEPVAAAPTEPSIEWTGTPVPGTTMSVSGPLNPITSSLFVQACVNSDGPCQNVPLVSSNGSGATFVVPNLPDQYLYFSAVYWGTVVGFRSAGFGPILPVPGTPTISGRARVTDTLTANPGNWSHLTSPLTYEWFRCDTTCSPLPAHTTTLVVTADLEGSTIKVAVTGAIDGVPSTVFSAPTATVISGIPVATSPPVITGTPRPGAMLWATRGDWVEAGNFTYSWLSCKTADPVGCTETDNGLFLYQVGDADVARYLFAVVNAYNEYGSTVSYSDPLFVPVPPPVATVAPALSGEAVVGQTLAGSSGQWSYSRRFSYSWARCDASLDSCEGIDVAGMSYTVTSSDVGSRILFTTTATGTGGSTSAEAVSAIVVPQLGGPPAHIVPTVTGTPIAGSTLTAATPDRAAPDSQLTWAWQRCDANKANCTDIADAGTARYELTGDDVGSTVRVLVTVTSSSGNAMGTSAPTAVVTDVVTAPLPPPPGASPSSSPDRSGMPTLTKRAVGGDRLPETGGEAGILLLLGLGLCAAGTVTVAGSRRRPRTRRHWVSARS